MNLNTSLFYRIAIVTGFAFAILFGLRASIPGRSTAGEHQLDDFIQRQYDQLKPMENSKPSFDLYRRGMVGYFNMLEDGKEINNGKITLIDFRLSSNKKRLWIIDLNQNKVIYYRLVAHGKNTGEEYARHFSNIKNSNQSSVGFYLTGENYNGKHGLSLRLDGMEPGFNDMARNRAIVMHSAAYVSKDFTKNIGRLGRSFGCPAIALKDHKEIIKGLANQSVLFIYYPLKEYEEQTKYNDIDKARAYYTNNYL
ncbi:MAG: murein L,D-transpeptidase catalytic domain family protein [Marinoscillum sp.]